MSGYGRARALAGVLLAAAVVTLGLTACGRFGGASSDPGGAAGGADTTNLTWEAQALEAIGFSTEDVAPAAVADEPSASPSAKDRDPRRHPRFNRLRFGFGSRMLHGEAVVQTAEGTKTVVVQRGAVTAVDGNTITVKSSDGYSLTWKFGDPIHVVEHRTQVQPSAIAVGTEVGVAGAREGDTAVARLIVIPGQKK